MGQTLTTQDSSLPNFQGLQRMLELPLSSFSSFDPIDSAIVDYALDEPECWKKKLECFFQPETQDDWKERPNIMHLTTESKFQRQILGFDDYDLKTIDVDFQLVEISEKEAMAMEARAMGQRHMKNHP